MLQRAANLIEDLFGGAIAPFLQEGLFFLGDVGEIFAQQLAQLPWLAAQILYRLALADHPLSLQELWTAVTPLPRKTNFYLALQALQRALYLEQNENQFVISTPIATYLLEQGIPNRSAAAR